MLTPQEAKELFAIIARAAGAGEVDHLHHPQAARGARGRRPDHRAARGKKVDTRPEGGSDRGEPRADDGRARGAAAGRQAHRRQPGETLLEVEDLHVFDDRGLEKVRGVSFQVRAGEIVGIAGVDGNGQTELIDAITGLLHAGDRHGSRSPASDVVSAMRAPARCSTLGVGHIPEDRQRRGLVLEFSIAENIALHDYCDAPASKWRLALSGPPDRAGATADQGLRRPRRRPADAAQARSPAATSRRSSSPARSRGTRRC